MVGNDDNPADWTPPGDEPIGITLAKGAGDNDSDRVTIIWDDNVIQNEWLQVTVRATANTGLAKPDVFYFGNAVGESGNLTTDAKVNAVDVLLARNNPHSLLNKAAINSRYDYNRNKRVNATDMLIARNNQTHFLDALKLIDPPRPVSNELDEENWQEWENSPGKLGLLYELEELSLQDRTSKKTTANEEAVDELLKSFLQ